MRTLTRFLAAAVVTAAWISAPAANAQDQSPSTQSPPNVTQPAPSIPGDKLDAAAAALQRVASLKESYQQQLAAAPPTEKERITNEANDAIVKAVEDQGLSVREYASILETARNNPDVREEILQRIRPAEKQ